MASPLRTSVVIDYQNVHLTGHGLFRSTRQLPRHETLVHPLAFAQHLIRVRNQAQREGMAQAVLGRVLVFRGEPSPEHDPLGYARNQAQKAEWERDRRVSVTLRALKYEYQRDATGRPATDVWGRKVPIGAPREKGVDVLCALATVREAQDASTDLVILASSDSDLSPALDEVRRLATAKVETFCWWDVDANRGYQIHPSDRSRPVWNTRLSEQHFLACVDSHNYG